MTSNGRMPPSGQRGPPQGGSTPRPTNNAGPRPPMGGGSGANGSYFPPTSPRQQPPTPGAGYGYRPAPTSSSGHGISTGYAPVPHFMSAASSNGHTPHGSPDLTVNSNNPYASATSPLMGGGPGAFSSSGHSHSSMSSTSPSLKDERRRSLHARTNSQRQLALKSAGGGVNEMGMREKYGGGGFGWGMAGGPDGPESFGGRGGAGPLSPKTPDAMHDMGRPLPRTGRSRYIIEKDAFTAFTLWSLRGWLNIGGIILLAGGLVTLFAGWPIVTYFGHHSVEDLLHPQRSTPPNRGYNTTGSIPTARTSLIDPDTPKDVYERVGYDGEEYELVFSDEFNVDGRTFWPGDDPFWEAVDLHYHVTGDKEWYDPDAATTANGSLILTITQMDPAINHNLNYRSAMLQTWNKFCFTGGYVEASAMMPGTSTVSGFWPAVWTMGNLGRAGYAATTDGMWPYSYNTCDLGTLANQTDPTTGDPGQLVLTSGDKYTKGHPLSWLPGQRLSRCTCKGEDHPGPQNSDKTYVGRSAPEIDVFEIYADEKTGYGMASQSVQMAPFDAQYEWANTTGNFQIFEESGWHTALNSYTGSRLQQAVSGLSRVPPDAFEGNGAQYAQYGVEYIPSSSPTAEDGFVTWQVGGKPSWSLNQTGLLANTRSMIAERPIPFEPVYLIANLGISEGFVTVDYDNLQFPAHLRLDYIRVYQRKDQINWGCDPSAAPTADYINNHANVYNDANLTTWADSGYSMPANSLINSCSAP